MVSADFPEFPSCFVCGKKNPRGLHTHFSPSGEGVKATFTADETLAGYQNTVHGGIISALLDEALIWAAYASTHCFGVTAELNVRFRKPLSVKSECIVEGKMVENRGKMWMVEARVMDPRGSVYASATGKVIPMRQTE